MRRLDLVCLANDIHRDYPLYPLLLVECKSVKLTPKVLSQVCGYNHYVKAYFVAVANQEEVRLGWMNKGEYRFVSGLPSYSALKEMVSENSRHL